jgi:alginate O-acetyltransferase complex protein AlgI
MDNFNTMLEVFGLKAFSFLRVTLPIGISFFVFHELSYIVDVYRKVKPAMKSFINYAVYIFLFPQLIAGPIIRFSEIADQIQNRKFQDNLDNRLAGLFRFSIGLAKKVLIANVLGKEADRIFSLPIDQLDFTLSWAGAIAYAFQIYFDFSGYSDMAIGLGRMMGFIFPENFNSPYISQSITDFWRRWHMSLSRWMRDYLYVPLGGNKVSDIRLYINLWTVFLISGFWHGAEWTFLFWGAYHGFFLAVERGFLLKITSGIGTFLKVICTFFILVVGWVFFRSDHVGQAFEFLNKMFSTSYKVHFFSSHFIVVLIIATLISFGPLIIKRFSIESFLKFTGWKNLIINVILIIVFLTLSIGEITSSSFNPFIYFQF